MSASVNIEKRSNVNGEKWTTSALIPDSLSTVRALKREILRREILENGRIDVLATDVLGYELRPFHRELLSFQSAATDACPRLAPPQPRQIE